MPASNYLRDALLDHVLRSVTYTDPAAVYMALFTVATDPEDDAGTECADGDYDRQALTFAAAVDGEAETSAGVTFDFAAAADIEGWGIYDASTAGNLLFFGAFDETISVSGGGQLTWDAATIIQTLT